MAEERLTRDEVVSGVSRRMSLMRQALDLDLIREHETWRLGDYASFFAYLQERKLHYERNGYDAEGDVLAVKGYVTIEAWGNIVRHYHKRHGLPLDLLAYAPKGKLEVASGACNLWDADHAGEMDPDLRDLLFDQTVTAPNLLAEYAERKREQGIEPPVMLDRDGKPEMGETDPDAEAGDGGKGSDDPQPEERELDVALDTETGVLTAWQRNGNGHVPLELGRLNVRREDARALILNLCATWGIRLQ